MLRLGTTALLVLAISATLSVAADRTYVDPRFGTTISFPDAIFTPTLPSAANNERRQWTAKDGAILTVWGQNNTLDLTPTSMADLIAKEMDEVTLRKIGSKWMIISGLDNGTIVYHRAEFGSRETIHAFELRYSAEFRVPYDRLASKISDSLIGP